MKSYLDHLDAFDLPASLLAMIRGEWTFPEDFEWEDPEEFEPYVGPTLPALIPLNFGGDGGDGHSSYGLWKHWFTPGRSPTYVQFGNEFGSVHEYARSPEQLVARLLGEREHALIPRNEAGTLDCLERLGLSVDDLPSEDADVEVGEIVLHPRFGFDWPRGFYYARDGRDNTQGHPYLGDFPERVPFDFRRVDPSELDKLRASYLTLYPPEKIRGYCGAEIGGDGLDGGMRTFVPYAPPWLTTEDDQPKVFETLLEAGDLSGAWMSVNSPNWGTIDGLRRAMERLEAGAGDPAFSRLVEAWLACDINQ